MKPLRVVLLLAAVLLCACTSYERLMDGWVGASEEELVATWGDPDSVVKRGDSYLICFSSQEMK